MVTSLEQCQMDQRDCRLSSGSDKRAKAFFQLADLGRQFKRGGRAVKSIRIADLKLVPAVAGRCRLIKEDRRSAIDWRCQRVEAFRHGSIRMNELGLPVFLIGHAGDCKAKRLCMTESKAAQTLPLNWLLRMLQQRFGVKDARSRPVPASHRIRR